MSDEEIVLQDSPMIVRVGETVRRENHLPSAVRELLAHLHRSGFRYAPRTLGIDERGREMLSFIPGESGPAGWAKVVPDGGVVAFARLLRAYHDAVDGFVPSACDWALAPRPLASAEIVTHGDFGPWNVVWDGDHPVGIVDWEFAGPGTRIAEVAYALEYIAPFRSDEDAMETMGYDRPPERGRRIALFAATYGLSDITASELAAQVVASQKADLEHVRRLAESGREPQRTWVDDGMLNELAERITWSEQFAASRD